MGEAPAIGFVKLHRKLLSWEWIGDPNVVTVFVQILLRVNREPKKWKGIEIPVGSFLTSRQSLAERCGLTEKQVRRALDVLETGRTIGRQRAGSGLLVSLANWEEYQEHDGKQGRQRATSRAEERPDEGRQRATTKEVKKERSREVEKSPIGEGQAHGDPRINEVIEHFKATMGAPPDDGQKWQRIHCANLLRWMEATYPDPDAVTNAKAMITAVVLDPFHGKNARSFKYLYQYRSPIVEAAKERKKSTKNLTQNEYGQAVAEAAAKHLADRARQS